MTLSLEALSGGLDLDHELFFTGTPENPDMRESTSVWLFTDDGSFGCPRIGIEGEAWAWEDRSYKATFGPGGGRILADVSRGPAPSAFDQDGRPTIFGAGPLTFQCLEPYRRWRVSFDGTAAAGTTVEMIEGRFDRQNRVPVRLEAELTIVTPGWVHDYAPEKVAQMDDTQAADAASMGIGWRIEQWCRARGVFTVDGETHEFVGPASRIKRQSVRPNLTFRGHVWQSALFPDGRAFGYIVYPPAKDGKTFNDGYIYQDGRMYKARAIKAPWLRRLAPEGEDVSLELESELGVTRIGGHTAFSSFSVLEIDSPDGNFSLQQTGVRYSWDDQSAYGMLERSATDAAMAAPAPF